MPDPRPSDSNWFLTSIALLQAAGLIESVVHDEATGEGRVTYTSGYFRLMRAGRNPFAEMGFVAALMTDNPQTVRAWVEREATLLGDQTADDEADATKDSGGRPGSR